jgi:hypothetical protein
LFARPASYREHLWHTARAALFAPILWLVFLRQTGGALLWVGVALVALDQIIEVLDVLDEKASRAQLGGLSSGEYALHAMLITSRSVGCALAFASRPIAAWSFASPSNLGQHPAIVEQLVRNLIPGAILASVAHVWLAWRFHPSRARRSGR